MLTPDLETYLSLAQSGRGVVLSKQILADFETPLGAYWKLSQDAKVSFLLESVTGGEQLARYSFVGCQASRVITVTSGVVSDGASKRPLGPDEDPLDALKAFMPGEPPHQTNDLPPFVGGAVGMIGYDFVRQLEPIGPENKDHLGIPDLCMMLPESAVVFDHAKNHIHILALADGTATGYESAATRINEMEGKLRGSLPEIPRETYQVHPVTSNVDKATYESMVARAVEYIGAGDCQQIVPSMRFSTDVEAHPLTIYRALRSINPSPYMFLLRLGEFDLVGASPELQVSLHGRTARVRPIAGTRWRGKTDEEDRALEQELLADEKERAEHIMLVDLGRNDIGRVSEYGSVTVNDLMVIERYSHVMHIVSDVTGTLRSDLSAYDLIRATFPAGTVSGSPKVRAMQIINELEPSRRGAYAGAVGLIAANGHTDLCITLRTIILKDGVAHVQAGAGVVYDSVPATEYAEVCNKARAALRAIEMAQTGLD